MSFRILYQDDEMVAIDKPAGFHVHPPEDPTHRIPRSSNCLYLLKAQLGNYLYPVHRLDRATSGVLVFAFQSGTANALCQGFQKHEVNKVYYCVVRGWTEEEGIIDYPLRSESDPDKRLEAITHFRRISTLELPEKMGKYSTVRYSLLRVVPKTGRMHQIRRHLEHASHPLVGDTVYGRGEHNRLFREKFKIQGLLLKAYSLELDHPRTSERLRFVSRWGGTWHQVFDLFGICPFEVC